MKRTYGDVSGYSTVTLDEKELAYLRRGKSAANPCMVVALVRRIDELEDQIEQMTDTRLESLDE